MGKNWFGHVVVTVMVIVAGMVMVRIRVGI